MKISSYDHQKIEEKWYDLWEKNHFFEAEEDDGQEPYTIVIPPPNVTGNLHMGHALNNTLQDILIRWQRMLGKSALWMPGMDHAGIATQNVVERLLKKEGQDRRDLDRQEFEKRVWAWKEESGGQIKNQLKKLGCSLDWPRERFTLDKGLSKAVRKVFVELYEEGLIYQGDRIINWCPRCETAISDIETEYQDLGGHLWHLKYPLVDSDDYIVVATTRPETMLGDSGVAVNPKDERYQHLIGKKVLIPLINREVAIFADDYVDQNFGTGLVKVTPAHDPNDFEMGQRHNLEEINIFDKKAVVNENGGPYQGLDRIKARQKVVTDLEKGNFLIKTEKHQHSVGHCYRCQTIIEPYLSKQWFVKIKPLADEAIKAVKEGNIKFVPKSWEKTYFEWMNNIRDWCISRQLWWGHRIPAFHCQDCGHLNVTLVDPERCQRCSSKNIIQDEDVLDTWFSSGLWPFSTLGWPEPTAALKKYYPTKVLVTGFDIIFFWVARMIMMGLKFTGEVPFRDVYIHALVRDEQGQKMSKSRGNVVDPLLLLDEFGADALRFTLAIFAAQGRDIVFSKNRIIGYRAFINKIWNATKFILTNLGESFEFKEIDPQKLESFDKWILNQLNLAIKKVSGSLESYKFNEAAQAIYDFWWHEFCDWYLELTKPRIYQKEGIGVESSEKAKQVLFCVLKKSLQLLHPFMPFVTEEIWSYLKKEDDPKIIVSAWPKESPNYNFPTEAKEALFFQDIVYKIRNIRGEMNIAPDKKADVIFKTQNQKVISLIKREEVYLQSLAKIKMITVDQNYKASETDATAVLENLEIFISLQDLIDFEAEKERLQKEMAKLELDLSKVEKKLSNQNFIKKAPSEIIAKEKEKKGNLKEALLKIQEGLKRLR